MKPDTEHRAAEQIMPNRDAAAIAQLFTLQHIVASEQECVNVAKFLRRLAPPRTEHDEGNTP